MFESPVSPGPDLGLDLVALDVVTPGPAAAAGREAPDAGATSSGVRGPVATALEAVAPGPALAGRLAGLDAAGLDDDALLEAVAGWERLMAWSLSRQAVALNELRRRRVAQRRGEFVGDEVAARLATTRTAGEAKVAHAECLERVPAVWDALDGGRIDGRKAVVLTDELLALPPTLRFDVAADLVPQAHLLTAPQLRMRVRRAALAADPAAAARAHARARADRFVSVEPVRDGMAWLHAFLPAPEAIAVHTALTAIADAQPPGDPRPVDARRADALVDVVTRWLDAGTTPDGVPLPLRHHRRPHLHVTAGLTTLLGLDDRPAELAGYGPISAPVARDIAARSTWAPVLVDDRSGEAVRVGRTRCPPGDARTRAPDRDGARAPSVPPPGAPAAGYRPPASLVADVVARDRTCTFPGCRVQAVRCDVDHIAPFDDARPPGEQTVGPNLQALCRHHHRLKTHGGWAVHRDDDAGITTWTAPTGHTYRREPEGTPGDGEPEGARGDGGGSFAGQGTEVPPF